MVTPAKPAALSNSVEGPAQAVVNIRPRKQSYSRLYIHVIIMHILQSRQAMHSGSQILYYYI